VIGGGLAGIVTALELEKQGIGVHLLELADRLGGKVATAHYGDGLSAELGLQELWAKNPLVALARERGLALEEGTAFSSVVLDGKLFAYTQDTDEAFFRTVFNADELAAQRRFLKEAERLYTEMEKTGASGPLARLNNLSFADWLDELSVPPRVAAWVRLTLECELAASAEQFSALSGLAELRMFLFGGERNYHVKGGNSKLIEALGEAIRGPKTLRARATRVERRRGPDGRLRARVSYLRDNAAQVLEGERVVLAIPWMLLHSVQLDPPLPPEFYEAVETIGRGQYTVVHFLLDGAARSLWGQGDASPFPVLTDGPLGVVYGVDSESPPDSDRVVFSLLVHGDRARAFHMSPHERKREELLVEIEKLWPGISAHVRGAFIYPYHPAAVPYWPAGRSPLDSRAQRLFAPVEGLYLAGDYLVSSHSEGAVVAAARQAAAIARDLSAEKPQLQRPAP
jgi:monoamine oxidase